MKILCKICIAKYGLSGKDLYNNDCNYAFDNEDSLMKHLKEVHNISVKKDGNIIN